MPRSSISYPRRRRFKRSEDPAVLLNRIETLDATYIEADPSRLAQTTTNFILNSCKVIFYIFSYL